MKKRILTAIILFAFQTQAQTQNGIASENSATCLNLIRQIKCEKLPTSSYSIFGYDETHESHVICSTEAVFKTKNGENRVRTITKEGDHYLSKTGETQLLLANATLVGIPFAQLRARTNNRAEAVQSATLRIQYEIKNLKEYEIPTYQIPYCENFADFSETVVPPTEPISLD